MPNVLSFFFASPVEFKCKERERKKVILYPLALHILYINLIKLQKHCLEVFCLDTLYRVSFTGLSVLFLFIYLFVYVVEKVGKNMFCLFFYTRCKKIGRNAKYTHVRFHSSLFIVIMCVCLFVC